MRKEYTPIEILQDYLENNFYQTDSCDIEDMLKQQTEDDKIENGGDGIDFMQDYSLDEYYRFHDEDYKRTLITLFIIDIVKENFDYNFFETVYKNIFKDAYEQHRGCFINLHNIIDELKKIAWKKKGNILIGGKSYPGDKKFINTILRYAVDELRLHSYTEPWESYDISSDIIKKVFDALTPELLPQAISFIKSDDTWSHDSTPSDISELAQRILEPASGKQVLDLCSGTGEFLLQYARDFKNKDYSFNGIDLYQDDSILSAIKLRLMGAKPNIEAGNIFNFVFPRKYDKIFCEPPFGTSLTTNTERSVIKNSPFEFSTNVSTEWFYLMTGLNNLSEHGKMVAVIPNGILQNVRDSNIRMQLLENHLVESVIQLPKDVLYGTKIMVSIIVFSHNNETVKFVDALTLTKKDETTNKKQSKNNILDVNKIIEILEGDSIKDIAKVVKTSDITKNYSSLLPKIHTDVSAAKIPNPHTLEEITSSIYRGIQFTYRDDKKYTLEPGDKHIVKLISASNIDCGKIAESTKRIKDDPKRFQKFYLKDGDIIISARGEHIKAGVFENRYDELFIPLDGVVVVRLKNKDNAFYVCAFLESNAGKKVLSEFQTGSTSKLLNASSIAKVIIPFLSNTMHQKILATSFQDDSNMLYALKKQITEIEERTANRFNSFYKVED